MAKPKTNADRRRTRLNFLISEDIARALLFPDDGRAAQAHLDAGHPIYYCEDEYPDEMVRKWPDGKLELVTIAYDGSISRARSYPGVEVQRNGQPG